MPERTAPVAWAGEEPESDVDNPRPEKVATVEELQQRFESSQAVVLTEYRGLTVANLEELRSQLRSVGTTYKVYKNTLVRRAIEGTPYEGVADRLTGPTAIAFCSGEVTELAKILRTFSTAHEQLVLKGGYYEGELIDTAGIRALAALPSRNVLLAQFAGALAAPLRQMAGLLAAPIRNFAYGLKEFERVKGGGNPEGESAGEPKDASGEEPVTDAESSAEPESTSGEEPVTDAESSAEPESGSGEGGTEEAPVQG